MTSETVSLHGPEIMLFTQTRPVCVFDHCAVSPGKLDGLYLLYMVNSHAETLTICSYDDVEEWQTEMAVLRRTARGGDEGGPPDIGVTAKLPPSLLATPASNAHALPTSEKSFLLS